MPSRYISRDGGILADRFTDEPYIFQNVHTLGGAARHTAAHTALLRAAAKSLFGFDPEITQYNFCTNGSHYAGEAGIKTIGLGPSRENLAHTIDEHVEIEQLYSAAECYMAALRGLLKE